jgi:hypothetical protein
MCAFIFHFAYRSGVTFIFEFESKELDFIKKVCKNIKHFPKFALAMALNPTARPNWPQRPAHVFLRLGPASSMPQPSQFTDYAPASQHASAR